MDEKDLGKTSTGMQANVEALLSYAFGWVTGLIFFLLETQNKFVRFHAIQSIITFGAITACYAMLSILSELFAAMRIYFMLHFIGLIYSFLGLVGLILWIVLMGKAYQGEYYKLPIAGDIAEKQINK